MHDERVVGRPSLRAEDEGRRSTVKSQRAESIHSLRREYNRSLERDKITAGNIQRVARRLRRDFGRLSRAKVYGRRVAFQQLAGHGGDAASEQPSREEKTCGIPQQHPGKNNSHDRSTSTPIGIKVGPIIALRIGSACIIAANLVYRIAGRRLR